MGSEKGSVVSHGFHLQHVGVLQSHFRSGGGVTVSGRHMEKRSRLNFMKG